MARAPILCVKGAVQDICQEVCWGFFHDDPSPHHPSNEAVSLVMHTFAYQGLLWLVVIQRTASHQCLCIGWKKLPLNLFMRWGHMRGQEGLARNYQIFVDLQKNPGKSFSLGHHSRTYFLYPSLPMLAMCYVVTLMS